MRREDREITDRKTMDDIIRRCTVCHLGLSDGVQPYVIPMSFGYDGQALYFHSASAGRKLDILKDNNRVCFEFAIAGELAEGRAACSFSRSYESVIGFGRASLVEGLEAKRHALGCIMRQYSEGEWTFAEPNVNEIVVIRIEIEEITGKARAKG